MATLTNDSFNTATLANDSVSASSLTAQLLLIDDTYQLLIDDTYSLEIQSVQSGTIWANDSYT